jgi:hypothetical protein
LQRYTKNDLKKINLLFSELCPIFYVFFMFTRISRISIGKRKLENGENLRTAPGPLSAQGLGLLARPSSLAK